MNQLRAVLMERGITIPQGRRKLGQHPAVMLDGDEVQLSPRVRLLVEDMRAEWSALDHRIAAFDDEFSAPMPRRMMLPAAWRASPGSAC